MNNPSTLPTPEERLLAAISHFFGVLIAFIIWIIEKDKSRFVRFQAVQALIFDLLVGVGSGLVFGCSFALMFLLTFGGMAGMVATTPPNGEPSGVWFPIMMLPAFMPLLLIACILPLMLGLFVVRLIAAIKCYQGEDFQYPWLGRQVKKWLGEPVMDK